MRVSVVIPCHNAEAWVADTLDSVLGQWRQPEQIIVVNDNSTDDSAGVIRRFGDRVHLIETAKGNAAAARNLGIQYAQGDVVAFLDADDVWYPWHLERSIACLEGSDDVATMSLRDTLWDNGRQDFMRIRWGIERTTIGLTAEQCYRYWLTEPWWNTIVTVARRGRLEEIGGFDETQKGGQDLDLWLRLIVDRTWSFLPHATARRRGDTPGSVSRTNRVRQIYYTFRGFLLNRPDPADPAYEALLSRYARSAVSIALLRPDAPDAAEYLRKAWPHLDARDRAFFRSARCFPQGYRLIHRLRQRLIHGPAT
ncbi:MAG: glycosyltransferase family 2 protein [Planctomycetota bacterium]